MINAESVAAAFTAVIMFPPVVEWPTRDLDLDPLPELP